MQSTDSLGSAFLDSLQGSLLAAAEIGGNRLLKYDEITLQGCQEMQGNCIEIDITDLDFQVYCHPGSWGIRISREPPPRDVDATIRGRLMALVSLAAIDDKVTTSIQEQVSFNGNVALAQKMQRLLINLDIDWEEALAEQTGDVLAFQIHQGLHNLGEWLQQSADSLLQTSSEYLREEARLSPTEVEFQALQTRITQLKHDADRSEARLHQLLEKIRSR